MKIVFCTQSGRPYIYSFVLQKYPENAILLQRGPGIVLCVFPFFGTLALFGCVFFGISLFFFLPPHTQCTHTHTHTPQESANVTTDGMANFATCRRRRRSNAQMDFQEQNVKYVMRMLMPANAAILAI